MVSASRLVASNQSGSITVPGTVKTVGVEPLSKMTSLMPDAAGVKDRVETSPQMYSVFAVAVMVGVEPLTVSVLEPPPPCFFINASANPYVFIVLSISCSLLYKPLPLCQESSSARGSSQLVPLKSRKIDRTPL